MVKLDYRLIGVSAIALLGLYTVTMPNPIKPFEPYDDDQNKRPRRPVRRPWRKPNKPWRAESFEASINNRIAMKMQKGKVKTLSGKPHTPKELIKDKDIAPEEMAKRTKVEAEEFWADPVDFKDDDDFDDERPTDWRVDKAHHELFIERDCSMCDRPYQFSKLSRALVTHYLKESKGDMLGWKDKNNPEGTRRTARNIAGYEMLTYGLDALEHFMLTQAKDSTVSQQVVLLLRKSIVPQILVGDVTEFIKLLEIDDVEEKAPGFDEDFWTKWDLEDYMNTEVFNEEHDDHDEIDALIKRLDDLNQFAITFMHDGGYGGEPISKETDDNGLTTEIVGYVEDSIRLKIISHEKNDEVVGIKISYKDSPLGPVIYLPPADYIAHTPEDVEHDHDHDHDHEHHHHEEEDEFIKQLNED